MATRAAELGRTSPRPNPRGGTRTGTAGAGPRSPRPSQDTPVRVVPKTRSTPKTRAKVRSARQNRRLLVTVCTLLTVGLAFSVVASQVFVAQNQDRLDKLNQRLADQQARYDHLRYQVAELESPERVAAAAQDKLGMVEPVKVNYVAPPEGVDASANDDDLTNAPDWQNVKSKLAAK